MIAEIRAHVLDAADAGVAQGRSRHEAIELAVVELGPPDALAARSIVGRRRVRLLSPRRTGDPQR